MAERPVAIERICTDGIDQGVFDEVRAVREASMKKLFPQHSRDNEADLRMLAERRVEASEGVTHGLYAAYLADGYRSVDDLQRMVDRPDVEFFIGRDRQTEEALAVGVLRPETRRDTQGLSLFERVRAEYAKAFLHHTRLLLDCALSGTDERTNAALVRGMLMKSDQTSSPLGPVWLVSDTHERDIYLREAIRQQAPNGRPFYEGHNMPNEVSRSNSTAPHMGKYERVGVQLSPRLVGSRVLMCCSREQY